MIRDCAMKLFWSTELLELCVVFLKVAVKKKTVAKFKVYYIELLLAQHSTSILREYTCNMMVV